MLIKDLDHLQSIDAAHTIEGGTLNNDTLFLNLLGGQVSLQQGETVLFQDAIAPPKQVTLKLQGASYISTSAVTQTINGVTQTTVQVSTQPPSTPFYPAWLAFPFFGLPF